MDEDVIGYKVTWLQRGSGQALLRRARSLHALDGIATVWVAHASRVLVGKPGRCCASFAAA